MYLDFHYYATFLAAKIAGFTTNESQVLAHAAQYVDRQPVSARCAPGIDVDGDRCNADADAAGSGRFE